MGFTERIGTLTKFRLLGVSATSLWKHLKKVGLMASTCNCYAPGLIPCLGIGSRRRHRRFSFLRMDGKYRAQCFTFLLERGHGSQATLFHFTIFLTDNWESRKHIYFLGPWLTHTKLMFYSPGTSVPQASLWSVSWLPGCRKHTSHRYPKHRCSEASNPGSSHALDEQ